MGQYPTNVASTATASKCHRYTVAAAFGLGLAIPILPGMLLAGRSNNVWVRRQATLAAVMQATLLAAAIVGTAAVRFAIHVIGPQSVQRHHWFQQLLAIVLAAPGASILALLGGLLAGTAVAIWWVGNLLSAVGALRGDNLGWPRLGPPRRKAA